MHLGAHQLHLHFHFGAPSALAIVVWKCSRCHNRIFILVRTCICRPKRNAIVVWKCIRFENRIFILVRKCICRTDRISIFGLETHFHRARANCSSECISGARPNALPSSVFVSNPLRKCIFSERALKFWFGTHAHHVRKCISRDSARKFWPGAHFRSVRKCAFSDRARKFWYEMHSQRMRKCISTERFSRQAWRCIFGERAGIFGSRRISGARENAFSARESARILARFAFPTHAKMRPHRSYAFSDKCENAFPSSAHANFDLERIRFAPK